MATLQQLTSVRSLKGERQAKTLQGFDLGGLVSQFAGSSHDSRGTTAPTHVRVVARGAVLVDVDGVFAVPPVIGAGPYIELADGQVLEVNLEGSPMASAPRGIFTQAALGVDVELFVEAGA